MAHMHSRYKDILITVIIYSVFGVLWITLSDYFLLQVAPNIDDFQSYSIVKGLIFVLLSALIIFFTMLSQQSKYETVESELKESQEKTQIFKDQTASQREVLFKLVKELPIPAVLHSENRQILMLSDAFTDIMGYTHDELPTMRSWVEKAYPTDPNHTFKRILKVYDATSRVYDGIYITHTKDTKPKRFEWYSTPIGKDEKGLKNVLSVAIDLSKHDEKEQALEHLSYHDDLTALGNRRYYREKKDFYRNDEHVGLMLSDINGLKLMNDIFGHQTGDRVLKRFAELLTEHLPTQSIICRVGGDEFTAIIPYFKEDEVKKSIQSIKHALKQEQITDIEPSASFGYANKKENESIDQTFIRAENMLYTQKVHEYDFHTNYMIQNILNRVYEKSDETPEHIKHMLALSKKLKSKLSLSKQEEKDLDVLINLHDIGKVAMNKAIFEKNQPLTDEEYAEIKKHPEFGYRIANALPQLKAIAYAILTHHENVDGSGYPFGLTKEDIPLISRVLRIIDSYETMTSKRHYKSPMAPHDAKNELLKYAGTYYDEEILEHFLDTLEA